ncbi:MAG: tripartite tricarboxylate transporter permease [Thermodesulfobacteriota bacterium]
METLNYLQMGFLVALEPVNILSCFAGCFIGTLIGVLPGLGPVATMSFLLPLTYHSSPVTSIIMLAGIYYGAMYGGSITSILVKIPGESASVVTCLDGHQMALQGRAGPALGISAFGSFIGGTIATMGLVLFSLPLVEFAIKFGPPEYFSLMVLGMMVLTFLSSTSIVRGLMMAAFGLVLATFGLDSISGVERFTFGIKEMTDGFGAVPVSMGLYGISDVLENIETQMRKEMVASKVKDIFPNRKDWARSIGSIFRGTVLGFFLGLLPGGGATVASFATYAIEKKVSKHPERFGKGAIEGVAAPETANNTASQASFIPLLTLGIPSNVVTAVLLGALIIHGITPGPLLLAQHPDLFWGVIASMYVGNGMLLALNLPLIGIWIQVLKIPAKYLMPMITLFCIVGAYSLNNNPVDVAIMLIFGVIGYVMNKLSLEGAPLILAFILGPMLETALRQSLLKSNGDFSIFITRPISATFLAISFLLLVLPLITKLRRPGAVLEKVDTG